MWIADIGLRNAKLAAAGFSLRGKIRNTKSREGDLGPMVTIEIPKSAKQFYLIFRGAYYGNEKLVQGST